jgi:hypothetical protein
MVDEVLEEGEEDDVGGDDDQAQRVREDERRDVGTGEAQQPAIGAQMKKNTIPRIA